MSIKEKIYQYLPTYKNALDSRIIDSTHENPEDLKETANYPFEGEIIYLSKLKKYYAITSLDEEEAIKSYVQISMPMIDIANFTLSANTINDIFWNPAEILFYDSNNGHKWDYNKANDNTEWLVSHPYWDKIGGVEGYYINRIPIIYSKDGKKITRNGNMIISNISTGGDTEVALTVTI